MTCSRSHSKSMAEKAVKVKSFDFCAASERMHHMTKSENCTMSLWMYWLYNGKNYIGDNNCVSSLLAELCLANCW